MDNKRNDNKLIRWKEKSLSLIISQLGSEGNALIRNFAVQTNLKILPFNVWLEKGNSKCCSNKLIVILYQKVNLDIGRMRVCCLRKIQSETLRVTKQLAKLKRSEQEIYQSSYKSVRGSIAHVIFQAFLGVNERKYIRESKNIKEESILRTVHHWTAPCLPEQWDAAIVEFQKDPSTEKVKQLICLYSPLYREDKKIISQMSQEIISYLTNLPAEWKDEEIRIVPTKVGIADVVVGEKIIEFKFTEKKIGWQITNFRQLYRYYQAACKINPEEKQKLKILCVFSPITGELRELTIAEAVKKWNLKQTFDKDFLLWELTNFSQMRRTENDILSGRIKGINNTEAKLKIKQRRKLWLKEKIELT